MSYKELIIPEIEKTYSWDSYDSNAGYSRKPPPQLLKWIGNKQRFAQYIANTFPKDYGVYFEPFLGSGAVLGAMSPNKGIAGDVLEPLIDLWNELIENPDKIYKHYEILWHHFQADRVNTYLKVRDDFNKSPNPYDFVFLSRTCYGGVIRFTKQGKMSTPIGPHNPIHPETFKGRMILWRGRVKNTKFYCKPYQEVMSWSVKGDIVYCDPPYIDSQSILYGSQEFKFIELIKVIATCKKRGVKVALSIDGIKKSGIKNIPIPMIEGLFERELLVSTGSSMLKRFQRKDLTMVGEDVRDRLLLTW